MRVDSPKIENLTSNGFVKTSGGDGTLSVDTVTYQPILSPAALTGVNDTNVTLTLGGTPATSLLQAVSLTLGWTGTLADGRIASAGVWNAKQVAYTNLTTIGSLANANGFLRQNGAGTFSYDTNTYLTGNQSIALSGDVSGSGTTAITTTIGANAVTYAKFQQVAASSLVGNSTGTLANAQGITLGAGLAFSAGTLVTSGIPNTSLSNPSFYIGTTSITLGRASGALALTGITSIDGQAATVVTNANLTGIVTSAGNATSIAANAITDGYISSAATWNGKQAAYTNLTSIGGLANGAGALINNGTGTFSYGTPWTGLGYLTGNQTITLSGVVTGSGTTAITTAIAAGAISNTMLANGAVANLSGTNTGDNAVNSLYSGLVSNANHTGDATGATVLTLATVNANVGTFNTLTVNAKGLVTAASNTSYASPTATFTLGSTSIALGSTTTAISGLTTLSGSGAFTASNFVLSGGTGNTGLYYGHTDRVVLANYTAGGIDFETASGTVNMSLVGANLSVVGSVTAGTGGFIGSGASLTSIPNSALTNSAVTVNGTSISLGASGTVTAAAGTLTGTTLNSTVVTSSLTSVGTLTYLSVHGALQVNPTSQTGIIGVGDNNGGGMNAGMYRGGAGVTTAGNYLNLGGYDGVVITTGAAALGSQTIALQINSSQQITTGMWNASTIGVAYGGTGQTTLTSNAILKGNGTSGILASSIVDNGSSVVYTNASNPVIKVTDGTYSSYYGTVGTAGAYNSGSQVGDLILRGYNGVDIAVNQGTTGLHITSAGVVTFPSAALGASSGGTGLTTLTSNYLYKGNGTSAMAVSSLTDDGTNLTSYTNGFFVGKSGHVGYTYIYDDQINFGYSENSAYTGIINYNGYANSNTQYRSLNIYNGKHSSIALFDGTNSSLTLGSTSGTGTGALYAGTGNFTGALTGTSATFSGNGSFGGAASNVNPLYVKTATDHNLRVSEDAGTLQIAVVNDAVNAHQGFKLGNGWLTFASTGAATFSSTINSGAITSTGASSFGSITLGSALGVAYGGTGSTTQTWVDLTTNQSSIAGNKTFSGTISLIATSGFYNTFIGNAASGDNYLVLGSRSNIPAIQGANAAFNSYKPIVLQNEGGNVLIGTLTDGGYKLSVSGTGNFTGALTGTSATFSGSVDIATSTGTNLTYSLSPTGWNGAKFRYGVPVSGNSGMLSYNYNGTTRDYSSYGSSMITISDGQITLGTGTTTPTTAITINSTQGVTFSSTINSGAITSSGSVTAASLTLTSALGVAYGGTGLTTLTSNYLYKGNGTSAMAVSGISDDGTTVTLNSRALSFNSGFGTSTPAISIYNNTGASSSNVALIDFRVNNSFGGNERVAAISASNPNASGNNGGQINFLVSANGTATTPTTAMYITQDKSLNLLGALTGTSATFSGYGYFGGANGQFASANRGLVEVNGSASSAFALNVANISYGFLYINSGDMVLGTNHSAMTMHLQMNGTDALTIASTGAATFSSSVSAGGTITAGTGSTDAIVYAYNGTVKSMLVGNTTGGAYGIVGTETNHDFVIRTFNTERVRFVAGTGAATFSSTINSGAITSSGSITNTGIFSNTSNALIYNGFFMNSFSSGSTNNVLITNSTSYNYGVFGVVSSDGTSTGDVLGFGFTPSAGVAFTPKLSIAYTGAATFSSSVTVQSTTASTSTTTGALIVSGGVGVAGALYVGGTGNFTGKITGTAGGQDSDITLKNLMSFSPLSIANSTELIKYTWKDVTLGTEARYGYSAQDIQKILPEAVYTVEKNGRPTLAVEYSMVHTVIIDEHTREINALKSRISELENRLGI